MRTSALVQRSSSEAAAEWRQYWSVELGVTIGISSGYAAWMYTSSVFVLPLQHAFGWSRGQIALVSYAHILSGFAAPFIGRLIDRIDVRPVLLASMMMIGLIYLALANMGGSIAGFYALTTLLTVLGLGTSGISFSRVITGCFRSSRGLALAVSRIGLAAAGAILPAMNYWLMAKFGWSAGYFAMATVALGIGLPVCWLFVRLPLAARTAAIADRPIVARSGSPDEHWSAIVGSFPAIIIILTAALSYAALSGILSQLQPILIGRGISASAAAQLSGILAVSTLIGAFVTGMLIDRFQAPLVGSIFMLLAAAGCVAMTLNIGSVAAAAAAIFMIGFAQGAEFDIMSYLIARYLGLSAFSTVYGFCVLAMSLSTAAGGVFFGLSYDATGGYDLAMLSACVCFVGAALLYALLIRWRPPAFD